MNLDLIDKHALVCGGSKGIGFAAAAEISLLGANVTLVSRDEHSLQNAVARLDTSKGQQHAVIAGDLSKPEELQSILRPIVQNKPVHILINNAGGPKSGPITDAEISQFKEAFTTHVLGAHLLVQLVLPGMRESGYGRIINIISTSVKQPIAGLGVSNTIRAAMGNWAKTLAGEVGKHGITVNNVLPGMTSTDRLKELFDSMAERQNITTEQYADQIKKTIPLGRFAEASELGNAIAFLASPAASYITGTNLVVDGGRTGSL